MDSIFITDIDLADCHTGFRRDVVDRGARRQQSPRNKRLADVRELTPVILISRRSNVLQIEATVVGKCQP